MGIQYWKQDGIPVAELTGPEKRIVDAPSALELAMTARHEAGASALLVDKAAVAEDFFILSTGLAGEILEKFIQYRIKMAVYGDFSYRYLGYDFVHFLPKGFGKALFIYFIIFHISLFTISMKSSFPFQEICRALSPNCSL